MIDMNMRSMEEEVEVGLSRGEDFLSEDDHSPTDASEDSVEVRVTAVAKPSVPRFRPSSPTHLKRPRPQSPVYHKLYRPQSPPNNKVYRPSSPSHSKLHKYRKLHQRQELLVLPARSSTPDRDSPISPRLHPPLPPSPQLQQYPSPHTSPLELHSGAAAAAAPLSPGRAQVVARNRRKPAEPRRLPPGDILGQKRAHSPEPTPPNIKVARLLKLQEDKEKTVPSPPSPPVPPLLHHPLLGPLTRPPVGPFPLLLPPAWPPVAAQWAYPRMVGPLGWAGLATPPHLPLGLLPPHYPIPRPLLHPPTVSTPSSPPPKFTPPPSPIDERLGSRELPTSLASRLGRTNSSLSLRDKDAGHSESSADRKPPIPKTPSKFLSVESLISSDGPGRAKPTIRVADVKQLEGPSSSNGSHVASSSRAGMLHEDDEDEDSIQALLAAGKQKQRNYKNMTRERRIEANARERTRVHTISAAFDTLRNTVPSYSHNQKLSKLSVLRIACSYILSLSRLAGQDYSDGNSAPSFSECVDLTTRTIQVEGKAKKKRDD